MCMLTATIFLLLYSWEIPQPSVIPLHNFVHFISKTMQMGSVYKQAWYEIISFYGGSSLKKKGGQKNRWRQSWSSLMLLEWAGRSSSGWLTTARLDLLQTAKQKGNFLKVLLPLHWHPETSDAVKIQSCVVSSFGLTSRRGFKSAKCTTVKGLGADRLGDILLLWTSL